MTGVDIVIGFLVSRKHNRLRALLSAYIDGQAGESEAKRVEEHLSGCEECRLELDTLRATVSLLRDLPELEVPRSFTLTEAQVSARPTPAIAWTAWTPRIAASAAALFLAALLVGDALGVLTQSEPAKDMVAPLVSRATAPEAPAPSPAPAAAAPVQAPVEATAPAAAPAPVAALAAPAAAPPEAAVEEKAVAMTPEREPEVETQADVEQEETLAPAVRPTATTPAPVDEAVQEATEEPGGIELPLWQLEVAAGGLLVVLALTTFLLVRRGRRPTPRRATD